MSSVKHQQEGVESLDDQPNKKPRISEPEPSPENTGTSKKNIGADNLQDNAVIKGKKIRSRKVVLLLSYSGWGYFGMQR